MRKLIILLIIFSLLFTGCSSELSSENVQKDNLCEGKDTQSEKDLCYIGLAYEKSDKILCENIADQIIL